MANQPLMKVKMPDGSWKTMGGTNLNAISNQVQADWDQNDPSAIDYIKNRTHYAGAKQEFKILEKTILAADYNYCSESYELLDDRIYLADIFYYEQFKDAVVKTTYNGVTYDTPVMRKWVYDDYCEYYFGNPYLIKMSDTDNGLPFVFRYSESWNEIQFLSPTEEIPVVLITLHHPDYPDDDITLFDAQTVYIDYEREEDWYDYYDCLVETSLFTAVNQNYRIVFDGQDYNLTTVLQPEWGEICLGDLWAQNPTELNPFVIGSDLDSDYTYIYFNSLGKHTIEIYKEDYGVLNTLIEEEERDFVPVHQEEINYNSYWMGFTPIIPLNSFLENTTPIVTFDGVEYETAVGYDDGAVYFAEKAPAGSGQTMAEGSPFYGIYDPYNGINAIYCTTATVNFQIERVNSNNTLTTIVPLDTYTFKMGDACYYMDINFFLEENTRYRIIWNGQEYYCYTFAIDSNQLGLGSIDWENPNYPFFFSTYYDSYSDMAYSYVAYLPFEHEIHKHTIGLKAYQSSLKCFDGKYLPAATSQTRGAVKALSLGDYYSNVAPVFSDSEGMLYSAVPYVRVNGESVNSQWIDVNITGKDVEVESYGGEINIHLPETFEGSWNDLTDKPFGDGYWEDCYSWDGQWSSLTTFPTGFSVPGAMCKVADIAPPMGSFADNCTIMVYDSNNLLVEDFDVKSGDTQYWAEERWGYIQNSKGEKVVACFYSNNIYGVEEGLYLLPVTYDKDSETIYTYTRFMYHTTFYMKPFEENLIPKSIARVSDVAEAFSAMSDNFDEMASQVEANADAIAAIPEAIPVPATAAVGQMIVVKAIDENGKPTEWEVVDVPSAPVTSINGLTGEVQLTIPTPFSGDYNDLTNKPAAAHVADAAAESVTAAEFNALLAALRAAGLMQEAASE